MSNCKYASLENQTSNDNVDDNIDNNIDNNIDHDINNNTNNNMEKTDLLNKLVIITLANGNLSSIHDGMQKYINKQEELINKYKLSVLISIIIIFVLVFIIYKQKKHY